MIDDEMIDDEREEPHAHGSGPDAANGRLDDRLLALALGLEDDPSLRAELERSPDLRDRFERIREDVAAIETGLDDLIPPQPEAWDDLSDDRWDRLRPYVSLPRTEGRPAPQRVPFWRRTRALVPTVVAVLAAVVVIGIVAGREGTPLGDTGGEAETTKSLSEDGAAAPGTSRAAGVAVAGAAGYDTVVVAEAGEPANGRQPFNVVQELKGRTAASSIVLDIEADQAVPAGTLAVLCLDPDAAAETETPRLVDGGTATETAGGEGAPTAAPEDATPDEQAGGASYSFEGRTASVLPLPAGSDPAAVRLE